MFPNLTSKPWIPPDMDYLPGYDNNYPAPPLFDTIGTLLAPFAMAKCSADPKTTVIGIPRIPENRFYKMEYKSGDFKHHACQCQAKILEKDLTPLRAKYSESLKEDVLICFNSFTNRKEQYRLDKGTGGLVQMKLEDSEGLEGTSEASLRSHRSILMDQGTIVITKDQQGPLYKISKYGGPMKEAEVKTLVDEGPLEDPEEDSGDPDGSGDPEGSGDPADLELLSFNALLPKIKVIFCPLYQILTLCALIPSSDLYHAFILKDKKLQRFFCTCTSCAATVTNKSLSPSYSEYSKTLQTQVIHARNRVTLVDEQWILTPKGFRQVYLEELKFDPEKEPETVCLARCGEILAINYMNYLIMEKFCPVEKIFKKFENVPVVTLKDQRIRQKKTKELRKRIMEKEVELDVNRIPRKRSTSFNKILGPRKRRLSLPVKVDMMPAEVSSSSEHSGIAPGPSTSLVAQFATPGTLNSGFSGSSWIGATTTAISNSGLLNSDGSAIWMPLTPVNGTLTSSMAEAMATMPLSAQSNIFEGSQGSAGPSTSTWMPMEANSLLAQALLPLPSSQPVDYLTVSSDSEDENDKDEEMESGGSECPGSSINPTISGLAGPSGVQMVSVTVPGSSRLTFGQSYAYVNRPGPSMTLELQSGVNLENQPALSSARAHLGGPLEVLNAPGTVQESSFSTSGQSLACINGPGPSTALEPSSNALGDPSGSFRGSEVGSVYDQGLLSSSDMSSIGQPAIGELHGPSATLLGTLSTAPHLNPSFLAQQESSAILAQSVINLAMVNMAGMGSLGIGRSADPNLTSLGNSISTPRNLLAASTGPVDPNLEALISQTGYLDHSHNFFQMYPGMDPCPDGPFLNPSVYFSDSNDFARMPLFGRPAEDLEDQENQNGTRSTVVGTSEAPTSSTSATRNPESSEPIQRSPNPTHTRPPSSPEVKKLEDESDYAESFASSPELGYKGRS
ncbi:hypothetical protein B9Z55_027230 [Caenorhabditis nigoni]|uniref:Uncharacterized protein n=1 Tax=Caenorhabditis nigoni TaxID=1611254 RepID=A0A2G5SH85_9PELO|nr:hypothetical protein B9Z55_027230 [Caenorhabditis nigoni]